MTAPRGARAARVAAQAKVNLRLRILAREASGYHQLETLFLRLTLADQLLVRITDGSRSLDVSGDVDRDALGPADRNLAWRAAESYARVTGWPSGFSIELEKRIPIGGGLGGGSADAGAVLRALDAMSPTPIGEPALLALAAELGADVPFLATSHAFALGWGRGERLLALPAPPVRELLLLIPAFSVETATAYGWLAAARESSVATRDPISVLDLGALNDWRTLSTLATNDFEPVVGERHPQITALLAQLRAAHCVPALMSGSGSTVFGVLPERDFELPRFKEDIGGLAPRVVLTRSAADVEPVIGVE